MSLKTLTLELTPAQKNILRSLAPSGWMPPAMRKSLHEALGWSIGLLPLVLFASWVF